MNILFFGILLLFGLVLIVLRDEYGNAFGMIGGMTVILLGLAMISNGISMVTFITNQSQYTMATLQNDWTWSFGLIFIVIGLANFITSGLRAGWFGE